MECREGGSGWRLTLNAMLERGSSTHLDNFHTKLSNQLYPQATPSQVFPTSKPDFVNENILKPFVCVCTTWSSFLYRPINNGSTINGHQLINPLIYFSSKPAEKSHTKSENSEHTHSLVGFPLDNKHSKNVNLFGIKLYSNLFSSPFIQVGVVSIIFSIKREGKKWCKFHEKKNETTRVKTTTNARSIYLRSRDLRICIENITFFSSSHQLNFEYRRDQINFAVARHNGLNNLFLWFVCHLLHFYTKRVIRTRDVKDFAG